MIVLGMILAVVVAAVAELGAIAKRRTSLNSDILHFRRNKVFHI